VFITLERLCCPFFGFALDVEPEGVKSFIGAEIGDHLSASLAKPDSFWQE